VRLPWGKLENIYNLFLDKLDFITLGCLSFEERCCVVPEWLSKSSKGLELIQIKDPTDAFPDYSHEIGVKTELNRINLLASKVHFTEHSADLLANEDRLLNYLKICTEKYPSVTSVVLDITSLPKRYFCFLVKRMLIQNDLRNIIVTYTEPGSAGYTSQHLAEDPMTCDHLPGFAAPLPPTDTTIVVSVGFESLSIKPLLEVYSGEKKKTKMLLAYPPNGINTRRQWNTLRRMVSDTQEIRGNLEVIAGWDSEQVYKTLEQWRQDSDGLALAPFGSKPHSLGMALFALKYDCGLYYTQPKSYNPGYTTGRGETWAYVVKWDGIPCYERHTKKP
jgi:hypothetical protein